MTITTKYNIGDSVWVISKNQVVQTTIKRVSMFQNTDFQDFVWDLDLEGDTGNNLLPAYRPESKLFPSKEELIKSL